MTTRTKILLIAFLFVSVTVALYAPSLHYDFIGLDDDELVVRNPDIKGFSLDRVLTLVQRHYVTLYVPVTMLSYAVDYQIWHLTPFGFRFTNVALHFLNAFLVFYLIRLIQKNSLIAFSSALIFILHPVQVESVVWIAERKNVLSAFFLFLSLIYYWKAITTTKKERKYLILTFVLFVLGMLSKPSVIVFLFLIFLINVFYFNGRHDIRRRAWFYLGVIGVCVLVTISTIFGTATDVEHYQYHGNSYLINVFVMMTVFWKYWMLLLFPYHQNILYSSPIYRSLFNLPVLSSAIALMMFALFLLWMSKRNKQVLFWLAWFLVGLIPVSNLIAPLPSIMNDRYLYVPMVGFFVAFFVLLKDFSSGFSFGAGRRRHVIVGIFMIFLFIPYAILTFQRIPDWKNAETLWQSALLRAPREDSRIYYYYGINQLDLGKYERSIELLKKSVSLHVSADALLALGTAYVAAGKIVEAEPYLNEVIRLDPNRSAAYDQLAVVYRKMKRLDEAKVFYEKAIQLQPRNAVLYNNYALYFMDTDEPQKAHELWRRALELDPDCLYALRNLVWYYYLREEWENAATYLIRYLRRNPNDREFQNLIPAIEAHLQKA